MLRLRVEGSFEGPGEVGFVERTFELQGNFFNADEMFLQPSDRALGRGRRLMGDLIEAAQKLGVDRIKIQTRNIGRYAWLRMGFRPDAGSWRDMRKSLLAEIFRHEEALGPQALSHITRLIAQGGPETANLIAAYEQSVPSSRLFDQFGQTLLVPLGKVLLLDATGDWDGEFVLADAGMMRMAREYMEESGHG